MMRADPPGGSSLPFPESDAGTVLITGSTGFAGSFLVEHYAARGWRVHGTYRNRGADRTWVPENATLHMVDLLDSAAVFGLIADTQPNIVHHLAAQSSVGASWNDPMGTLRQNAEAQFNLLEAIRALAPTTRVLVVGSCDEYGAVEQADNPISEEQPLCPLSPYAISKVTQDLMAYQYAAVDGLRIVRVRPFLQLGPRRAARFVTGSFARQIAEIEIGQRESVISVGNIDLKRDFTDVRDVVRAYALAGERGASGEVYNIASGRARSLEELLHLMLESAGVRAEIRRDTVLERAAEPPLVVGDASKLQRELGWIPEFSFEESVRDTLDYWRSYVQHTLV